MRNLPCHLTISFFLNLSEFPTGWNFIQRICSLLSQQNSIIIPTAVQPNLFPFYSAKQKRLHSPWMKPPNIHIHPAAYYLWDAGYLCNCFVQKLFYHLIYSLYIFPAHTISIIGEYSLYFPTMPAKTLWKARKFQFSLPTLTLLILSQLCCK